MDDLTVGDKECGTALMMVLCSAVFAVMVLCSAVSHLNAANHPLCELFAEMADDEGVSVAVFNGHGWDGMPDVWDYETYTELTGDSGILIRVWRNQRWLWGFRTLSFDETGNHDFCDYVLIVTGP